MKFFRTIGLLALLNVGLIRAVDNTATNRMPPSVHALMEQSGHGMIATNLDIPAANSNSLRNLPPIKKSRLRPLQKPVPKSGWSFWNLWKNVGVKYVHSNHDPMNAYAPAPLTPYSALAQFEYDLTYSFDF